MRLLAFLPALSSCKCGLVLQAGSLLRACLQPADEEVTRTLSLIEGLFVVAVFDLARHDSFGIRRLRRITSNGAMAKRAFFT